MNEDSRNRICAGLAAASAVARGASKHEYDRAVDRIKRRLLDSGLLGDLTPLVHENGKPFDGQDYLELVIIGPKNTAIHISRANLDINRIAEIIADELPGDDATLTAIAILTKVLAACTVKIHRVWAEVLIACAKLRNAKANTAVTDVLTELNKSQVGWFNEAGLRNVINDMRGEGIMITVENDQVICEEWTVHGIKRIN